MTYQIVIFKSEEYFFNLPWRLKFPKRNGMKNGVYFKDSEIIILSKFLRRSFK